MKALMDVPDEASSIHRLPEVPAIVPQCGQLEMSARAQWRSNLAARFSAPALKGPYLSGLTLFGLFAVTAMLVTYAFEKRSPWFILAFAASCGLGSIYGFLQGAWPFGVVEAIWAGVAVRRWLLTRRSSPQP
jgi:hypothetical protein